MSEIALYFLWSSKKLADLHGSMQIKAFLGRIVSSLTGHSRDLLDLSKEVSRRNVRGQHEVWYRTVPINRIKGSEGRLDDFDREFNPKHARTRDRWVSVAVARSSGVALPAVDLIQLDEDYFVRDGHHRISVARAFGEEYIDAKVTVLELEPVTAPQPTSAIANNSK